MTHVYKQQSGAPSAACGTPSAACQYRHSLPCFGYLHSIVSARSSSACISAVRSGCTVFAFGLSCTHQSRQRWQSAAASMQAQCADSTLVQAAISGSGHFILYSFLNCPVAGVLKQGCHLRLWSWPRAHAASIEHWSTCYASSTCPSAPASPVEMQLNLPLLS